MKHIIVTGISTDIGKTIASAVMCQLLNFSYWKPIQAGNLANSDTMTVANLTCGVQLNEELYRLKIPESPHKGFLREKIKIDLDQFVIPSGYENVLIELAGGVMTPICETFTNVDLIKKLNLGVLMVIKNYLGSINHSLLSIQCLQVQNVKILGLIVVGETDDMSEKFIEEHGKIPIILRIPFFENLTREEIFKFALNAKNEFNAKWENLNMDNEE